MHQASRTDGQKDHEKIRRFIERVKHGISRTNKEGFYGKFGDVLSQLMTAVLELEECFIVKVRQIQVSKRS